MEPTGLNAGFRVDKTGLRSCGGSNLRYSPHRSLFLILLITTSTSLAELLWRSHMNQHLMSNASRSMVLEKAEKNTGQFLLSILSIGDAFHVRSGFFFWPLQQINPSLFVPPCSRAGREGWKRHRAAKRSSGLQNPYSRRR